MKKTLLGSLLLVTVIMCIFSPVISAWKYNTHLFIANVIMDDARDGKVYIPPYGQYAISDRAREVLNFPEFYRGGNIGSDGFPDIVTGQYSLQQSLQKNNDSWLQLLWDRAEREKDPEIWAFLLGFLTQIEGDMWADNWILDHAGGPFPGLDEFKKHQADSILIAARYRAVENTFDNKVSVSNNSITIPVDFVSDTLILSDEVKKNGLPDWLNTLVDLYRRLPEDRENEIATRDTYKANLSEDLESGFKAWVMTNEVVMKKILEEDQDMFDVVNEYWTDWALNHYLDMLGIPSLLADSPGEIIQVLEDLPDEVKQLLIDLNIVPLLENMDEKFVNGVLEMSIGLNQKEMEEFFNREVDFTLFGEGAQDILAEIGDIPLEKNWVHNGNQDRFEGFIDQINIPLYNSVITGKLILLPPLELKKLIGEMNYQEDLNGNYNTTLDLIRLIDTADSNLMYN